jgi:hypothetical protein
MAHDTVYGCAHEGEVEVLRIAVRREEVSGYQVHGTLGKDSKPQHAEAAWPGTSDNDRSAGIAAKPARNSVHRTGDRTVRSLFPSSVAIRTMAEQLRIAANPDECAAHALAWLDAADRLDAIAMALPTAGSMMPVLRGAFGIKGRACTAVLDTLLSQPGAIQPPAVLANVVGCSPGSIKVFISQLRQHLRVAGFLQIIRNTQSEGYYITDSDAATVLNFANGVRV